ncbi:hypothetical protein HAV15_007681 [Penicillium sp. str. |nr:hypothetical protein HAV15_007681 [Penicillium sp. str. \
MCGIVEHARTKSVPSPQDCAVILGEADGILRKSHRFLQVWKPEAQLVHAVAIHVAHFVLRGIRDASSRTFVGRPEVRLGVHDLS